MSDDDEVTTARRRRPKRRALRVPVDDVPRRSAVSDLPPATAAATAAGEAALDTPAVVLPPEPTGPAAEAVSPSVQPPSPAPAALSTPPSSPPPSSPGGSSSSKAPASPSVPSPAAVKPKVDASDSPTPSTSGEVDAPGSLRSSYPPPPSGAGVMMAGTVRVSSPDASAEADMLDPFAEMPDAAVDGSPLQPESTQVLAEDDLVDDEDPDSVELRIDELDDDEADAVVEAAISSGAIPPPSVPEAGAEGGHRKRKSPSDTVPGVSLAELDGVADEVGVVDEADDDEPELTVTESDELDLDDDLEELDDELEELDDAFEEETPPASPKAAPPTPPADKAPPAVPDKPPAPPASKPDAPKPPVVPEVKKKRRKPWFEGFFSDDYLRTVRPPTPKEVSRECDFITEQLGLPRGATILDVGCGLGLHAIELTRRGYLVVGLDLSLPMLSRAGDEAQDEGLRINFLHGDMRQMTFEGQFDAVLCWGTTFGYLDDEGNQEVVKRLLDALKPKGILLLDIVNRDHVIQEQPNLVWFEGDGCVCMEESRFDYLRSRLHVKRTVILDDGRQRENTYSIRLYSPHEIGKLLHQTGFRVTKLSGMKATPGVFFGVASPQLIILAERRAEGPPTSTVGQVPPKGDDEGTDEPSAETKPGSEPAPEAEAEPEGPAEETPDESEPSS